MYITGACIIPVFYVTPEAALSRYIVKVHYMSNVIIITKVGQR